jgi:hypothetical protein
MATMQTTTLSLSNPTAFHDTLYPVAPALNFPLVFFSLIHLFVLNMPTETVKRPRIESTRLHTSRENVEALKRNRDANKAAAKARKGRRKEATDDDLLIEREEESPEVTKLRGKFYVPLGLPLISAFFYVSSVPPARV